VGTLVVDALLTVDQPLPPITLARVLSPEVVYSPEAAAEPGARVRLRLEPENLWIQYSESARPGTYVADSLTTVRPETAYELEVVTREGEVLRARTVTPPPLSVRQWLLLDGSGQSILRQLETYESKGDSVYFAPENQLIYAQGLLEARFDRPAVEAFQVGVFSLDPDSDFVIEPEFFEDEDFAEIDRQGSSPAFEARDGTVRLPWFAIFFQGRYQAKILALDTNAYDFLRSVPQNSGGFAFGGSTGENFTRPVFRVEGGIGLFGSASADSVGFFILPRP
jgi:hypothetical protein